MHNSEVGNFLPCSRNGNWANLRSTSITITVAQLCCHFEQRELARSNTWRSYSLCGLFAPMHPPNWENSNYVRPYISQFAVSLKRHEAPKCELRSCGCQLGKTPSAG